MNICCIYSVEDYVTAEKPLPFPAQIPYGISYIATSLKQAGYNPHIVVFNPETDIYDTVKQIIDKYHPNLFCLTSVTSQYPIIVQIAKTIKLLDESLFVILGGPHATLNPDEAIKEPSFNAICIGEGEKAIVQLASQIDKKTSISNIKNLWVKNEMNIVEKNDTESFIQDLDNIPFIDRELWYGWIANRDRTSSVLVGRGCPNKCSYCSNHSLAKISKGKYVRFRSPENIINEVNEIVGTRRSAQNIYLEAESLSINLKYTFELCDKLEQFNSRLPKPIYFSTNLSITKNVIGNEELFKRLKKANFKYLNIGLESGCERIRSEILRRPKYSNEDIIKFCKLARENDIDINLFVMIGIPGETISDFKQTITCVRECSPQYVYLSIFYPYPGTDLYFASKNMGLFNKNIINPISERKKARLDLPHLGKKQIQREYYLFYYKVFKGKKPIYKVVALTVRHFIMSYPRLNSYFRRLFSIGLFDRITNKLTDFRQ